MATRERAKLKTARIQLGLSLRAAGELVGKSGEIIRSYEAGEGTTGASLCIIRDLCRAYMARAEQYDYEAADYHESVLCPGEFPKPKQVTSPERAA